MTNIYLIHRWEGTPNSDWYQWLKSSLNSNYHVDILKMPDPENPVMGDWVNHLEKIIGPTPEKNTVLIGHSIGCQAILRYLETLDNRIKIKGVILVAPWVSLTNQGLNGVEDIAKPWLETPIIWKKVRVHSKNFICIFSDNDYYVSEDNIATFKDNLKSKIIMENNKGHLTEDDGVDKLPVLKVVITKLTA